MYSLYASTNECMNFLAHSSSYLTHSLKYAHHDWLVSILRFNIKTKPLVSYVFN